MGVDCLDRAEAEHGAEREGKIGGTAGFQDKCGQRIGQALAAKFFRTVDRGPATLYEMGISLLVARWQSHLAVAPLGALGVADPVEGSKFALGKLADPFDNRLDHIFAGTGKAVMAGQSADIGNMFEDEILFATGGCKAHEIAIRCCLNLRWPIAQGHVRLK